jgi:hypothetical protein
MTTIRLMTSMAALLFSGLLFTSTHSSAAWTPIPLGSAPARDIEFARACRAPESGPFGPVWRVALQVKRKNSNVSLIAATVVRLTTDDANHRGGGYVIGFPTSSGWAYGGQYAAVDAYLHQWYPNDVISFQASSCPSLNTWQTFGYCPGGTYVLGSAVFHYHASDLAIC